MPRWWRTHLFEREHVARVADYRGVRLQKRPSRPRSNALPDVQPVSNASDLQVQVNELRRAAVADEPQHVALFERAPRRDPRCRRLEVTKKDHVVAQPAPLAHGAPRDHCVPKERSGIDDLGVAHLVLERDRFDRRAARLGEVDATVTDGVKGRTSSLRLVRPIEVVPADHRVASREAGRDRVAVGVVVRGAVGEARDLFVDRPAPSSLAVRILGGERVVAGASVTREVHAGVSVGERSRRAERLRRQKLLPFVRRGGKLQAEGREVRRGRAQSKEGEERQGT